MGSNSISTKKITPITAIAVAIVFLFTFGAAAQVSVGVNWYGPNGNLGTNNNYVNQNQVTAANVKNLEVKWIFPVPAAPKFYAGSEGVITTPNVVNGIAYMITNWNLLLALDARDGHTIWSKSLPVMKFLGSNLTFAHYHRSEERRVGKECSSRSPTN